MLYLCGEINEHSIQYVLGKGGDNAGIYYISQTKIILT